MSLRFHEISEQNHRILNPFTLEKMLLVGDICRLKAGMKIVDLGCGKGEMLSQFALLHGIEGVGVDVSKVFVAAARARSAELNLTSQLTFIEQDGATFLREQTDQFDIVSCIGVTWIGGGLVGMLELMKPLLRDANSLLLVGEPFWREPPPSDGYERMGVSQDEFATLVGTLERFEATGFELVEMVLANEDSWDRYVAGQWLVVSNWLRENPEDEDAPAIRAWIERSKRNYLDFQRRCLGWGVFVLRLQVIG